MFDEQAEAMSLDEFLAKCGTSLEEQLDKLQAEWDALSPEEQQRCRQKSHEEFKRWSDKRLARMTKAEVALSAKIGGAVIAFDALSESEKEWLQLSLAVMVERDQQHDAAEAYRNRVAVEAPHVGEC
jgi:hypothetical protein